MFEKYKMDNYEPDMSFEQQHTILYTFQHENAISQFITTMDGNVAGGGVMDTEFDCGVSAPIHNEINKKYVLFDEESELPYRDIEELRFFYPDGDYVDIPLDECTVMLVGIQIIGYRS